MKTSEENATVWGIHCTIDKESMFHKNSVMAIGWNDMGDLSKIGKTREAFKAAYQKIWANDSKMTVAVQAWCALEAAYDLGFPYGGLIPKGRLAEDGATDIRNCQMLCKTHNRAKGNR